MAMAAKENERTNMESIEEEFLFRTTQTPDEFGEILAAHAKIYQFYETRENLQAITNGC